MSKNILIVLSLFVSFMAHAEEVRIAVVDMQECIRTVDEGKKAKTQLEKDLAQKQKEMKDEEAAIRKAGEEFKKQSLVLSDEARMKKQGEIQEKIVRFQEKQQRAQGELQHKEQTLLEPVVKRLKTVVADLAKKKNYTMVLEKAENVVLFSLEKDDLTKEVISTFNAK